MNREVSGVFILDDILLSPLKALVSLAERIGEQIDLEQNDEATVMKQLLEVQLLYEMDEISEEEYEAKVTELTKKIQSIREQAQNQFAEEDQEIQEEADEEVQQGEAGDEEGQGGG